LAAWLQRHAGAQQDVAAKVLMDLRKSGDAHLRMLAAELVGQLPRC
jgi:hypothetical protein